MNDILQGKLLFILDTAPRVFACVGVLADNPREISPRAPMVQFLLSVERGNNTDYYRVTVWRELARLCMQELHKGDKVKVVGEPRSSTYTRDGAKHHGIEIVADCVEVIDADDVEFVKGGDK